tara:strand:+ start:251 stop:457 length:207 start_codon:yes stop_codon:yes gene_type:complete
MSPSKDTEDERREKLISSYAIAQYHLGIEKVLTIKRNSLGYEPLDKAPINKLQTLINILRKEFKKDKK